MLVEMRNIDTGEATSSSREYPVIPKTGAWCFTWADGTQEWYKEGKLHRLDGPAATYANSDQYWYKEGKLHRLDGPAATFADGAQQWYKEGKLHRLGGPAITYANGEQEWFVEDEQVDPPC